MDDVRVGSLTVLDNRPRFLTIKDKACLLDLADAVSAIITARYREARNLSRQKMISVLNMAHHVRTPLMSATLVNSTLAQDCRNLLKMRSLNAEGAAVAHRMRTSVKELHAAFHTIEAAVSSLISEADAAHKEASDTICAHGDANIAKSLSVSCTQPIVEPNNLHNDSLMEYSLKLISGSSLHRGSVKHTSSSYEPVVPALPPVVLVVEDSIIIQKGMKRFLESTGCVVHTAVNGKLGLELLTTLAIDAVFVDFLMVYILHCYITQPPNGVHVMYTACDVWSGDDGGLLQVVS